MLQRPKFHTADYVIQPMDALQHMVYFVRLVFAFVRIQLIGQQLQIFVVSDSYVFNQLYPTSYKNLSFKKLH